MRKGRVAVRVWRAPSIMMADWRLQALSEVLAGREVFLELRGSCCYGRWCLRALDARPSSLEDLFLARRSDEAGRRMPSWHDVAGSCGGCASLLRRPQVPNASRVDKWREASIYSRLILVESTVHSSLCIVNAKQLPLLADDAGHCPQKILYLAWRGCPATTRCVNKGSLSLLRYTFFPRSNRYQNLVCRCH